MVSIIYKDERPGPTKKWLDPLGFGGKFVENNSNLPISLSI